MNNTQTILEILKYTIPALLVVICSYLIVKKFLVSETERKRMAIFQEGLSKTIPLRLQAYERLAIYLERIHPRNIIGRVYESGMTNAQLQLALLQAIKSEYEHNLSQQIYVSNQAWKTLSTVMEQEMAMINNISATLKPENSAKELHTAIINYIMSDDDDVPVAIAQEILRDEAKLVLNIKY